MLLAVKIGEVAMPCELVVTVAVVVPPAKVPLGPLAGTVNVTLTPLRGLPLPFVTVATKGAANAVLICADCEPPLVAVMEAGTPAVLVSEKTAAVSTPFTVALIV